MNNNPPKRRALGRGLSALLPTASQPSESREQEVSEASPAIVPPPFPGAASKRVYFEAQIEEIHPSPEQPRKRFLEPELEELAQSVKTHGVIQPLIVRSRPEGGYYLIAGERRWRAAQRAGLHQVPVVVQEVAPKEAFERALVENLQRADLNAIEEAEAYSRLVEQFQYTQEEVAERVGKDRSTVTNSLRLLRLPMSVRAMVEDGNLSMGHARALLGLESDAEIETAARNVLRKKLSVRAVENLVKLAREPAPSKEASKPKKSASVRDLENKLMKSLGAQVQIEENKSGKGGRIEIRYIDLDDLERLLERLLS